MAPLRAINTDEFRRQTRIYSRGFDSSSSVLPFSPSSLWRDSAAATASDVAIMDETAASFCVKKVLFPPATGWTGRRRGRRRAPPPRRGTRPRPATAVRRHQPSKICRGLLLVSVSFHGPPPRRRARPRPATAGARRPARNRRSNGRSRGQTGGPLKSNGTTTGQTKGQNWSNRRPARLAVKQPFEQTVEQTVQPKCSNRRANRRPKRRPPQGSKMVKLVKSVKMVKWVKQTVETVQWPDRLSGAQSLSGRVNRRRRLRQL